MKCSKCNIELKPGTNFCTKCGEKIETIDYKTCSVNLESSISGICVYINGIKTEYVTPCLLTHLNPGKYYIHLEDDKYYSNSQSIETKNNDSLTLNFELIEFVRFQIISKHDLVFSINKKEYTSNTVGKIRHGAFKLVPDFEELPAIDFQIPTNETEFIVEYDIYIKYTKIEFVDFPGKVSVLVRNDSMSKKENIIINPKNEIKYFSSTHIESIESNSLIELLPGRYGKINWNCNAISGYLSLNEGADNFVHFTPYEKKRNKRKRTLISISSAFLLVILSVFFYPYFLEASLWSNACSKNTFMSYQKYMDKYFWATYHVLDDGRRFDNSIYGYSGYREYPYSKLYYRHENEAKEAYDLVLWQQATSIDSSRYFRIYLEGCYNCINKEIAINNMDSLYKVRYPDYLFDKRDAKVYKTVKIGEQVWMASNLKHEESGDNLTPASDNYVASLRFERYYHHNALNNCCPEGWHVPSEDEWNQLVDYLANNGYSYDTTNGDDRFKIAKSLASKSELWDTAYNEYGRPGQVNVNLNLNNKSGFNAKPVGELSKGKIRRIGESAYFWTSSLDKGVPISIEIEHTESSIRRNTYGSGYYYSVRCIKD